MDNLGIWLFSIIFGVIGGLVYYGFGFGGWLLYVLFILFIIVNG